MTLARRLTSEIAATGPIPVSRWMALCNARYYATRDPLGVAGDFTTAPEISQMFGELIGAWFTDIWQRAGAPKRVRLVELGPGRGTLMADMLRGMAAANWTPDIDFVETSPALRIAQRDRVPGATWHDHLAAVPDDAPLLLVANEFFDALPVRQFVRTGDGWRERLVGVVDSRFVPSLDMIDAAPLVPHALWNAPMGSVVERSPVSTAIAAEIGVRLRGQGGAALIIDYGHAGPVTGDTLQAVSGHTFADPYDDPGEADLTCHVDFASLAALADAATSGPVRQGDFLRALGIGARAAALRAKASTAQRASIEAAVTRLTGESAMGGLFKVMALRCPQWPDPAGFA